MNNFMAAMNMANQSLANIGNSIGAADLNKSNRKWASQEAEKSFQRQKELMQMQQEYNSPANMRQLLKEGGYNPNSLLGSSVGSSMRSVPNTAPQAQNPSSHMIPISPVDTRVFAETRLLDAQARHLEAQTNEIPETAKVDRMLGRSQADYYNWQAKQGQYNYNWLYKTEGVRMEQLEANLNLTDEQAANFKATTASALYNLEQILPLERQKLDKFVNEVMPKQIERIESQMKVDKAQAAQLYANAFYLETLALYQEKVNNARGDEWFEAELNKLISDGNLAGAKYESELKGLPYLIKMDWEQSAGVKITGVGGGTIQVANGGVYNPASKSIEVKY